MRSRNASHGSHRYRVQDTSATLRFFWHIINDEKTSKLLACESFQISDPASDSLDQPMQAANKQFRQKI